MDMAELRQEGEPFDVVMNRFLAWCGEEEYCFCTWGSMDLTELQRNMAYHKLPNPFPRPLLYLDIQKLYCLQYGDGKNKVSLDMAVQIQGMEEERPFHRRWTMPIIPAASFRFWTWRRLEPMCRWIITDFPGIRLRNTGCISGILQVCVQRI